VPAAWSPSQYGFLTYLVASRQAAPSVSVTHDANRDCGSIKLPPTSSFSFAHLAADGQDESEGRTRCFIRVVTALAIFVRPNIEAKPPDKSGSVAAMRNTFLLFIDPYSLITASNLAVELADITVNERERATAVRSLKTWIFQYRNYQFHSILYLVYRLPVA
jgi:hypothetical protein